MKLISNKDIFQRVKVIIGSKKIKAVEDDPGYEFDFGLIFQGWNMPPVQYSTWVNILRNTSIWPL